jgi:hypothetical protein
MIALPALALLTSMALAQDDAVPSNIEFIPEPDVLGVLVPPEDAAAPAPAPAPVPAPVPAAPPPRTLEEVWADQGPSEVLVEAIERRTRGDFDNAEARLQWLDANHPSALVTYQSAVTAELSEEHETALLGYDEVLARHGDDDVAQDAAFRRALVLEDLGRHRDATQQVKRLQRSGHWSEPDHLSLELARGVNELGQGRTRRGLRRIGRSLAVLDGSKDVAWMQAKARAALARHLLDEAAIIPMVNGRKAVKNLQIRASAISEAEHQIIAVATLGEPEYSLVGLELLGDGYMALHDDLLAAPVPKELTSDQADIFREALAERAGVLARKAWRYYDQGVSLAARTQWRGAISERLRARRDALGLDGGTPAN